MLHAKVTKCVCLDINKTIFSLSCCSFDIGIESSRSFSEGLDRKARKKTHTHDLRPLTGLSFLFIFLTIMFAMYKAWEPLDVEGCRVRTTVYENMWVRKQLTLDMNGLRVYWSGKHPLWSRLHKVTVRGKMLFQLNLFLNNCTRKKWGWFVSV